MKELYLMRHAQTLFNVQRRTQGWSDSPLTQKGIDDALKAGERLRAKQLCFDAFYSSTQERASDTLELLFPNQAYSRLKGLKEMNFGAYEAHIDYLEPMRLIVITWSL
ncbi:histidine phosphatase family protein [Lactococcus formosensis]|uniref:histidine phosphatase family protein n=1 Tax=Lactococcus formosensis TaxID=1281486 RepID=UPI001F068CC6|nr:histidine phosphatase family protein [Lactococcus formosensis]MCH1723100.1 histidine phosphatase family protein [Lactococcus formosensis]MDG6112825.1 histidine phosphatase family protein [Lactococcus formosensis]MDG6115165.1 histidine phosphatase family protein [Lactococcus formosensis]MDG6121316.1 histidine phosphatase family protein [Lactococcus formosensis]MDG6124299.1 histidine phosphatase family protein [Lactococcus formosensis]